MTTRLLIKILFCLLLLVISTIMSFLCFQSNSDLICHWQNFRSYFRTKCNYKFRTYFRKKYIFGPTYFRRKCKFRSYFRKKSVNFEHFVNGRWTHHHYKSSPTLNRDNTTYCLPSRGAVWVRRWVCSWPSNVLPHGAEDAFFSENMIRTLRVTFYFLHLCTYFWYLVFFRIYYSDTRRANDTPSILVVFGPLVALDGSERSGNSHGSELNWHRFGGSSGFFWTFWSTLPVGTVCLYIFCVFIWRVNSNFLKSFSTFALTWLYGSLSKCLIGVSCLRERGRGSLSKCV